jgi:hypothetical protein
VVERHTDQRRKPWDLRQEDQPEHEEPPADLEDVFLDLYRGNANAG